MDKKKAMAWVKALRSGKFKQGQGHLSQKGVNGKKTWCCLGVLAEINNCDINKLQVNGMETIHSSEAQQVCTIGTDDCSAYDDMGDKHDIKVRKGNEHKVFDSLLNANDSGVSFKSIATWIEKNYKLL